MITVRRPEDIYQAHGAIANGEFHGRRHFSFGDYRSPDFNGFGTLFVFNDDILSPGAVRPLHQHHDIEVVTYCAGGEFRHMDDAGRDGVLKKGWVQHTTAGSGMSHAEMNNLDDAPVRFIQIWFKPAKTGLPPSIEQKAFTLEERTSKLLPVVSSVHKGALFMNSDAIVYASFLREWDTVDHGFEKGRGAYLYVIEGEGVRVNGHSVHPLGAAAIEAERKIEIEGKGATELLMMEVPVKA